MGIFARIKKAWYDTIAWETVDEEFYDELEESLIMADLGASVAADTIAQLRRVVHEKRDCSRATRSSRHCVTFWRKSSASATPHSTFPQRPVSCSLSV